MPKTKNSEETIAEAKDYAQYEALMMRFVNLANQMNDEGSPPPMINAALMLASGFYASFLAVGNERMLDAKSIDQVAGVYRKNLSTVQKLKQQGIAKSKQGTA